MPGLRLQAKRHIAMHDGHLVGVNERGHPYVTGDLLASQGIAFDSGAWRARIDALEADGATEIAFQPAGHNTPRELEAFARMLQRQKFAPS